MSLRAVGRYIAIEPIEEEIKSGFLTLSIDDKDKQRFRRGTILSVGSEVIDTLKQGDIVYYDKVNSFELLAKGKPVTIIRQADVVSVEE